MIRCTPRIAQRGTRVRQWPKREIGPRRLAYGVMSVVLSPLRLSHQPLADGAWALATARDEHRALLDGSLKMGSRYLLQWHVSCPLPVCRNDWWPAAVAQQFVSQSEIGNSGWEWGNLWAI